MSGMAVINQVDGCSDRIHCTTSRALDERDQGWPNTATKPVRRHGTRVGRVTRCRRRMDSLQAD